MNRNDPDPPGGEYVVSHERPFPHRLDRWFRVGAIVVAVPIFVVGLTASSVVVYGRAGLEHTWIPVALATLVAALAYGFTRAVGLIATSVVAGLRRKAYVVDWQDGPPGR